MNIDHVATIRQARRTYEPDPVWAATEAQLGGADGITVHLREDRRHIQDRDVHRLAEMVHVKLNLEMAATEEMLEIALKHRPHAACIVPEKRREVTTEGGLDAAGGVDELKPYCERLSEAGVRVSLFVDPEPRQLEAAMTLGAPVVELHTGAYCEAFLEDRDGARTRAELERIVRAAELTGELGLECHAGHGLTFDTVGPVAHFPGMSHQHEGLSVGAVQPGHQVDDFTCGLAIQIPGGLVGPDNGRLIHQGAGYGHPLALSSG